MPRSAPAFWRKDGIIPALLSPFSCLYMAGHRIKWALSKPYRAGIPVICIGGVTVGGSGKTPTLHAILSIIKTNGLFQKPVILLRGYGGTMTGPIVVDVTTHTYKDVGDESLLHARHAPTIISAVRSAGVRLAEQLGADIILMDDGLQNNTIEKTLSLLVIDGEQGIGNGRVLPAGPLREPLKDALSRVGAIVQIGIDAVPNTDVKHLPATIMPQRAPEIGKTYFAFAGLGHPDKFRLTLQSQGVTITDFVAFPDHHPYSDADIIALKALSGKNTLITTEKDFVRIPLHLRDGIETLPIILTFQNPKEVAELVRSIT
jgi:tetraacyldisaccharide 4'-kinase